MQLPIVLEQGTMTTFHGVYPGASGAPRAAVKMVGIKPQPKCDDDMIPLLKRGAVGTDEPDTITLSRSDHDMWLERGADVSSKESLSETPPFSAREIYLMDPFASFQQQRLHTIDARDGLALFADEQAVIKLPIHDRLLALKLVQISASAVRSAIVARYHPHLTEAPHMASVNRMLQRFGMTATRTVTDMAPEGVIESLKDQYESFVAKDTLYRQAVLAARDKTQGADDKQRLHERTFTATADSIASYVALLVAKTPNIGKKIGEDYSKTGLTTASLLAEMSLIAERRILTDHNIDPEYTEVRSKAKMLQDERELKLFRAKLEKARIDSIDQRRAEQLVATIAQQIKPDLQRVEYASLYKRATAIQKRLEGLFERSGMRGFTAEERESFHGPSISHADRQELHARNKFFYTAQTSNQSRIALEQSLNQQEALRWYESLNKQYQALIDWAKDGKVDAQPFLRETQTTLKALLQNLQELFDAQSATLEQYMKEQSLLEPSQEEILAMGKIDVKQEFKADVQTRVRVAKIGAHIRKFLQGIEKDKPVWSVLQKWDLAFEYQQHQRALIDTWSATHGPESKEQFFDAVETFEDSTA